MALEIGRRAFISSMIGTPFSFLLTHLGNRVAAIEDTVNMRNQNQLQNRKPPSPKKIADYHNGSYWWKVAKKIPVNVVSGTVISFIVNKTANPLNSSLRILESEIPDPEDRPHALRDTKVFAREITRRSLCENALYYAMAGSVTGFVMAMSLDHESTVERIHGPMRKGVNDGVIEITERERTKKLLFLQDCVAYMLRCGGTMGAIGHIHVMTTCANGVRDAIDKHRITQTLSQGSIKVFESERAVEDLRDILPDSLKTIGTELEVSIRRKGEIHSYRIAYMQKGMTPKFVVINNKNNDKFDDVVIPLIHEDEVTISVVRSN